MLGFGLTSAVMTVAKDWFARHWRVAATVALGLFGPLAVARQPLRPAARLQRHLPRLGPDAEVEAPADFPGRTDPVPGRRGVPRLRLPEEQPHVRPRLFRRPRRLRALRARLPPGDVRLRARQSDRRAARALARSLRRLVVRPGRAQALVPYRRRGRARLRRPFRARARPSASRRSPSTTTRASPTRENFPDAKKVYESASPFGYLEVYSSSYLHFAPGPVRQRRLQPADDARQRLSRHVYRQRRPDRRHARSDRQGNGLFPLPADGLPLCHQVGPEDVHHPVRRRNLDRGRAAFGRQGRHGRRRQSRGARGVPMPT